MSGVRVDPEREAAIESCVSEAQLDAKQDGAAIKVMVCAGWPRCELEDDGALDAMGRQCLWCSVILVQPDGSYSRSDPAVV